jgi:hypothetical protein
VLNLSKKMVEAQACASASRNTERTEIRAA